MNSDLDQELEQEISRELQGLPDLAAPPGLLTRTMKAVERPAPWHKRSWNQWPVSVRTAFIVFALAAVLAAVLGWRAVEPGVLAAASRRFAPAAAGVECLWNFLSAVAGAMALAVEYLGKGFMLACLAAVAVACATCAGLGAIFVRLALARPGRTPI